MADLAKCSGDGCPFKYSCRRFTAPVSPAVQAWIDRVPYEAKDHTCAMFLRNGASQGAVPAQ